ncbi:MAG: hypothetical protein CO094_08855 [Anaerolineae bacterium CG_4_9_14_3_um_filter_57_17]|nr:hypothetical protein [bacterium]NCT21665.1 hypothetical protein [bacterium]OIO86743.1 MAG: hypothetical protein AUK01_02275 [Anaerolineae bacterium CG2_30_57_67]PJB65813.1 MAG: hypothetical protein CO094_08855 [Anaerolineae bacterium CG_4_9_14_3_um_filter_57_17]
MIGKFFKLVGNVIKAAIALVFLGVLAYGAYFAWRVNDMLDKPMPGEAQRYAPGLTFREFWDSRLEQKRAWDDKLEAAGYKRACEKSQNRLAQRAVIADYLTVKGLRAHEGNAAYRAAAEKRQFSKFPADEILYGDNFFAAWWETYSNSVWWFFANDKGMPLFDRNPTRVCSTTLPVHNAQQANGQ